TRPECRADPRSSCAGSTTKDERAPRDATQDREPVSRPDRPTDFRVPSPRAGPRRPSRAAGLPQTTRLVSQPISPWRNEAPSASRRARGEAVSRAAHGLDETIVPEFLQRLAQAADVHVDGALFHVDVSAPDTVEKLFARVHPLGMRHEELEHAEFRRPERDGSLADEHA